MKIYFSLLSLQGIAFQELDVSESITAQEVLELPKIKELLDDATLEFKIGVNSVALDGKYKALPQNYRMSDGERLEVYKPLKQDPKERRKAKADLK
ncbi:RnfH family protein [Gammaproteobacteria bacterium]|nr:RnfH family protein [Gammaproteobacteria bacterium]MDB9738205.1 RnfH family protein [Gammaproteobacteria bacterium]MDB9885249.1 RnfH family protein [Gammaproteobacteria bacterium]MDC3397865.1 RnfH family protein [Gammaproteobacteria bacterium]